LLVPNPYRFRVALSFPGESRTRVESIANQLAAELGGKERVFYDNWYKGELARFNLYPYLQDIYYNQALLRVFFLSRDYASKEWCGLEWETALDLHKKREDDGLMLLRMDDGNIPGLLSIHGYLDIRILSDADVTSAIQQRLRIVEQRLPANPLTTGEPPAAGPAESRNPKAAADPGLVIYFNRSRQATALTDFLSAPGAGRENRPLAFLVSGRDSELHDQLHERLVKRPLPQELLGQEENMNKVRPLMLDDEPAKSETVLRQRIARAFRESLGTPAAAQVHLNLPRGLTYFRSVFNAEEKLTRAQAGAIEAVLRFLDDRTAFPDLPDGYAMCVGISITWSGAGPSESQLNKRFPAKNYPNLRFLVLPSLDSPRKSDTQAWVDLVEIVKGALGLQARESLLQKARLLFGAADSMPMRDLFNKFTA
jgi:hypothetical protein